LEAKKAERQSWFDNDVFEIDDLRKIRVRNSRRIKTVSFSSARPDGYLKVFKINKRIHKKQIVLQLPDQVSDVQLNKQPISVGIFFKWI